MKRRTSLVLGLALSALFTQSAHAQAALDEIMAKKAITIAIPTDFPPYGFVGVDLKPQGLDIDMANYIGAKLPTCKRRRPTWSSPRLARTLSARK